MLYALILIFTGQYVTTTAVVNFQSKDLCEAARTEIATKYEMENGEDRRRAPKLTAYCVPISE